MILLALLLKKDPSDMGLLPDGAPAPIPDPKDKQYQVNALAPSFFKTKQLWQLCGLWISISIGVHLVIVHVVAYAVSGGIDKMNAAFVMSAMGLSSIIGRLWLGRLSDQLGRRFIGVLCCLIQFGVLLFLIWARSLWMVYLFGILFGLMWGGAGTIMTAMVGDIFGTSRIGVIMGITSSMWGMGAAVGPALGGILYDTTGHYSVAFSLGAIFLLGAAALIYKIEPLPSVKE
jgi:predicted MFS family arabinose efflux permease